MEIAYFILGEFPCSIHKHPEGGHLCGYIGVPPSHPWSGLYYDDIEADCHGGLTYSDYETVRSIPSKARREYWASYRRYEKWDSTEYDVLPRFDVEARVAPFPHDTRLNLWWVGFDCAHYMDTAWSIEGTYRDEAYVRQELEGLARQAAEAYQEAVSAS